jgi:hypothetical protein
MAELINLRQARKRAQRKKKDEQARANRAGHGASKAVRSRIDAEREKSARMLDAHRIGAQDE